MSIIIDPKIPEAVREELEKKFGVSAASSGPAASAQSGSGSSSGSSARTTTTKIVFKGANISSDIAPYLLNVSYTDNEEDQTDDLQITLQDREGVWVKSWLKEALEAVAEPKAAEKSGTETATVNAKSGLILRAGPSKQTARLTAAPFGSTVTVTDSSGSWWACSYGGQTGYMWGGYLTKGAAGADANAAQQASKVERGFPIAAQIVRSNWDGEATETLDCGEFELDSVDCSGPPSVITIKASSLSFTAPIRQTKKTKAWESYKLSGIATEMATAAGMSCQYLSESDPTIKREEQTEESDIAFLSRLTHNAGLSLKCANNSIIIFDQLTYEKMGSIGTITKGEGYTKYKLSTSKADTQYASARVSYTNPENGQLIEGIAKVADYNEKSKTNQQLEIHQKVGSIGEAQELAKKLLRMHNKFAKTATFNFAGNPKYVAGATIDLKGFGPWDGKYMIKQAKHDVGNSGYTTQITLRNVLEAY